MSKRLALLLVLTATSFLAFPAYAGASYSWPVKPFDRQHPIRGTFDDPRISTRHIDTPGNGSLSFHFGVDIAVPDGTPVYSVSAGTAHIRSNRVAVVVRGNHDSRGRLVYGYWHIRPAVSQYAFVQKHQLLGYVLPGMGHVHFAESQRWHYVNPLRRGGLTPYSDRTKPTIQSVSTYMGGEYQVLDQEVASGTIRLVSDIFDRPSMRTPWHLEVLTPYLVRWKIVDELGNVVVPARTVVDFQLHYSRPLTSVYAPGTLQNGPRQRGVYNFWLARNFDTTKLPNGAYRLKVMASDIRGNRSARTFGFEIAN